MYATTQQLENDPASRTQQTPLITGKLKLMVANRGEIAVRVLRAGRDAGFKTLAIFSEEDRVGGHIER